MQGPLQTDPTPPPSSRQSAKRPPKWALIISLTVAAVATVSVVLVVVNLFFSGGEAQPGAAEPGTSDSAGETEGEPEVEEVVRIPLTEQTGLIAPGLDVDLPAGFEDTEDPEPDFQTYKYAESSCTVSVIVRPLTINEAKDDATLTAEAIETIRGVDNEYLEEVNQENVWIPAPDGRLVEFAGLKQEYIARSGQAREQVSFRRVVFEDAPADMGYAGILHAMSVRWDCPEAQPAQAFLDGVSIFEGYESEDEFVRESTAEVRESAGSQ